MQYLCEAIFLHGVGSFTTWNEKPKFDVSKLGPMLKTSNHFS